jgi:hypothetical protein
MRPVLAAGHPATGRRTPAGTIASMELLAAAKPWAYWIAPMILVMTVLAVLAYILMYVFKVVAAKYPKT